MKKTFFPLFLLLLAIFLSCSFSLHAEETTGRKGFFLGFGPYVGGEVNKIKQVVGGLEFRIGAGLTDNTLLYAENNAAYTNKNDLNYFAYDLQAKIQHFFYEGLYANAGFGFSAGTVGYENFAGFPIETKIGFGASGGLGYEFRPSKRFAIGPEVALYYRRLGGFNYLVPTGILHMNWYF